MKKHILSIKKTVEGIQIQWAQTVLQFIRRNLFELELLAICILLGKLYRYIPYMNIYLSPYVIDCLVILIAIWLLKIVTKTLLIWCIMFFFLSMVAVIIGKPSISEFLGNILYFMLFCVAIGYIGEVRKDL